RIKISNSSQLCWRNSQKFIRRPPAVSAVASSLEDCRCKPAPEDYQKRENVREAPTIESVRRASGQYDFRVAMLRARHGLRRLQSSLDGEPNWQTHVADLYG